MIMILNNNVYTLYYIIIHYYTFDSGDISKEETGCWSVPIVDWCKVCKRTTIRIEEKLARISSKTNNIHNTKKMKFSVKEIFNKCE